jgi:hypothetical protein
LATLACSGRPIRCASWPDARQHITTGYTRLPSRSRASRAGVTEHYGAGFKRTDLRPCASYTHEGCHVRCSGVPDLSLYLTHLSARHGATRSPRAFDVPCDRVRPRLGLSVQCPRHTGARPRCTSRCPYRRRIAPCRLDDGDGQRPPCRALPPRARAWSVHRRRTQRTRRTTDDRRTGGNHIHSRSSNWMHIAVAVLEVPLNDRPLGAHQRPRSGALVHDLSDSQCAIAGYESDECP